MPSILTDDDRETVKRMVPKPSNKIHAVAVARLYIAYPDRQRWTDTGLQGAAILADDLVGNTYWLKIVDISPSNRGVIWDQEIYDGFTYNQDRTFFHSFELEHCVAAFSFVDEKEAKTFKKKMDEREKNASKGTKANHFRRAAGSSGPEAYAMTGAGGGARKTSLLGGFSHLLHPHRATSAGHHRPPMETRRPVQAPPLQLNGVPSQREPVAPGLDGVDPSWQGLLTELLSMGISEDQIEENADFIKSYIEQKRAAEQDAAKGDSTSDRMGRSPPPPPPGAPLAVAAAGERAESISPQHTGGTTVSGSKRGPAPPPPAPRRSRTDVYGVPSPPQSPAPLTPPIPQSPPRNLSPAHGVAPARFAAPPPLADAGRYAHSDPAPPPPPPPPPRPSQPSIATTSAPPPPRPPKVPMDDPASTRPRFGVPPPPPPQSESDRVPFSAGPPPPPPPPPTSRNAAPPPPTREHASMTPAVAPLAEKTPYVYPSVSALPPPPPPAPPLPPPSGFTSPVPPPPPPPQAPAAPPFTAGPPPPPPLPSSSGPPPPLALPTHRDSGYQSRSASTASPLSRPSAAPEDMFAAIRDSGGIGGGRLRKLDASEKRDRSAAILPGAAPAAPMPGSASSGTAGAGGGGEAGLAQALAAALSKRKTRVSQSDDEEDEDDDWDEEPKARR